MKKKNVVLLAFIMFFSNLIMADSPPWTGSSSYTFSDSDPYFSESYITNTASVDIIGGAFNILHCYESSVVNMSNGTADTGISAHGSAQVYLTGGEISILQADELSLIFMIVENYNFIEDTFINFNGTLTGNWPDEGGSFEILIGDGSWAHIQMNVVPEPCSILFFGLSFISVNLKKRFTK